MTTHDTPEAIEHVIVTELPHFDRRPCVHCGSRRSWRHLLSGDGAEMRVLCDSVEACHRRRIEGRRP